MFIFFRVSRSAKWHKHASKWTFRNEIDHWKRMNQKFLSPALAIVPTYQVGKRYK